jgi:hypothetical protein
VGATLVSGVVGWLAGLALSPVISGPQSNHSAGFTRNLWVFSLIFTMNPPWIAAHRLAPFHRLYQGFRGFKRRLSLRLTPARFSPSAESMAEISDVRLPFRDTVTTPIRG